MVTDVELLKRYAFEHSEQAFGEFVGRHIKMVYAASLRECGGDASLAEDLCQSVFMQVAGNARRLCRHPAIAGWLYTSVRHSAANLRRREARRRQREHEACAMSEVLRSEATDSEWLALRPVLDDAMHQLPEKDQAVVVLRFFEQRTIEEVGAALGLNKSAAHMRIERALEKLRKLLAQHGITSTGSGLTAVLMLAASASPPETLAAGVTATVASCGGSGTTIATTTKLMIMTKLKIACASILIVAGVATPIALQKQALDQIKGEKQALLQQLDDRDALLKENQRLSNELASRSTVPQTQSLTPNEFSELLRLRGQVGLLRRTLAEKATPEAEANPPMPVAPSEIAMSAAPQKGSRVPILGDLPILLDQFKVDDSSTNGAFSPMQALMSASSMKGE
jgi:RNA polymerase sigma factor (sigma-70 family)